MALSSGEKKLLAVCALALAIPLLVAGFYGHINATPVVATTPRPQAPKPNGYDLYVQAANSIKAANPPVDARLDTKTITDPKVRAGRYSLQRKDAWLAQNRAGFALFAQAQKADSLVPPFHSALYNRAIRQMARYKVIESNAHWQRGDYHRALQSGLDIAQLGYDVQRGGDAMDYITGNAFNSLSSITTGDTIEHLTANQARVAARRIEKLLATRWTLEAALIEDKKRRQQDWLAYFKRPDWRADFLTQRKTSGTMWGGEPPTWKEHGLVYTTSKHRIMDDLDALYERAIADARSPYTNERAPQFVQATAFTPYTAPNPRIHFSATRALTADRILMLRLALHAHKSEHGIYPSALKSLVPVYINAVPADPFGKGEPLSYKSDGKIYKGWSIGPDGRDDSGTPVSWRKKTPQSYADQREQLPPIFSDSPGDYVAGKNY